MLVVQNKTAKEYSDEDVEVLESTAMVVAEQLVSGAVAGTTAALEISSSLAAVIKGTSISDDWRWATLCCTRAASSLQS